MALVALVKNKLAENPLSSQLFVFINRKCTQCKVLYFDHSGYCIWRKRLEQEQFHTNAGEVIKQTLSLTDLKRQIDNPNQLALGEVIKKLIRCQWS